MVDARRKAVLWLPLAAWLSVIFHYSLMAAVPAPAGTDISILHVPAYFILSALFLRLFIREGIGRGFALAILASTGYGLAMETLQPLAFARTFSYMDIILNLAGSCLILALLPKRSERLMRLLKKY